jgi:hypothetical protein
MTAIVDRSSYPQEPHAAAAPPPPCLEYLYS